MPPIYDIEKLLISWLDIYSACQLAQTNKFYHKLIIQENHNFYDFYNRYLPKKVKKIDMTDSYKTILTKNLDICIKYNDLKILLHKYGDIFHNKYVHIIAACIDYNCVDILNYCLQYSNKLHNEINIIQGIIFNISHITSVKIFEIILNFMYTYLNIE